MSRWWCFPADDPWTNQHTQHWNTLNIFHLTWCGSSEQFENRLLRFTQHYWTNLGILSLTSRIQSILTLNSCLTVFLQQLTLDSSTQDKANIVITELHFEQKLCFSVRFTTPRGRRHSGGFVCSLHSGQNLILLRDIQRFRPVCHLMSDSL